MVVKTVELSVKMWVALKGPYWAVQMENPKAVRTVVGSAAS